MSRQDKVIQVTSKWVDGMCFVTTDEANRSVVMGGSAAEGCARRGPDPMEMLLVDMTGCFSTGVVVIVRKQRQDITGHQAAVTAGRAEEPPRVFTEIRIHFVITGRDLKAGTIEQTIRLSVGKYYSASIMLGKTTEMAHSFEIIEA